MNQRKPNSWEYPNPIHPSMRGAELILPINDKGGIVHDQSGRRNHGINNGATWVDGPDGPALSFATTSYIQLPTNFRGLDGLTDFTVICKVLSTNLSVDNGIFYTDRHAGTDPLLLWFDEGNNKIGVIINGASGGTGALYSSLTPVVNTWYNISLVFSEGSVTRLYIDGVEDVGSGDFPDTSNVGALNASPSPYRFCNGSAETRQLLGKLGHASIYRNSLSLKRNQIIVRQPWAAWGEDLSIAQIVAAQGGVPPVTGGVNLLDGLFERKRLIA